MVPSIVLAVFVAGLVGMLYWRFNESLESNRWVDVVVSAPEQIEQSVKVVEDAEKVLERAAEADFKGKRFQKVVMLTDETEELLADYSEVLQYVADVPQIDEGPLATAIDPLSLGSKMEANTTTAVVPANFQVKLAHFTTVRERLAFSTESLEHATENLEDGLTNLIEIQDLQKKWEKARTRLKRTVKKTEEALLDFELRVGRAPGGPVELLAVELEAAENLLEDHPDAPDEVDQLKEETKKFKAERKALRTFREDTEEQVVAIEDEAALRAMQERLEAERIAREQQEQQQQVVPTPVPPAGIDTNPAPTPTTRPDPPPPTPQPTPTPTPDPTEPPDENPGEGNTVEDGD